MKKTLCLIVSGLMFSFVIASECDSCCVVAEKQPEVKSEKAEKEVKNKANQCAISTASKEAVLKEDRDMKRCYRKNKKPVTMEDEAMRRAKVFHRGLPIEGCAPLSPEEHKARFDEEKRKQQEKAKAEAKK